MSKSNGTKGKSTGRPKKPETEKHSKGISVWVTPETKDRISRAATAVGDSPSRWLGKVGDSAARKVLESLGTF